MDTNGALYLEGADNSKVGLNHNFAADAISSGQALKIDFNLSVGGGGTTAAEGVSFAVGNNAIAELRLCGKQVFLFFLAGAQTGTKQYAAGS